MSGNGDIKDYDFGNRTYAAMGGRFNAKGEYDKHGSYDEEGNYDPKTRDGGGSMLLAGLLAQAVGQALIQSEENQEPAAAQPKKVLEKAAEPERASPILKYGLLFLILFCAGGTLASRFLHL